MSKDRNTAEPHEFLERRDVSSGESPNVSAFVDITKIQTLRTEATQNFTPHLHAVFVVFKWVYFKIPCNILQWNIIHAMWTWSPNDVSSIAASPLNRTTAEGDGRGLISIPNGSSQLRWAWFTSATLFPKPHLKHWTQSYTGSIIDKPSRERALQELAIACFSSFAHMKLIATSNVQQHLRLERPFTAFKRSPCCPLHMVQRSKLTLWPASTVKLSYSPRLF